MYLQIEATGPLLILHNFPSQVENAPWMHFIDNAALAAVVKGSSPVMSGDHIACRLKVSLWFDEVESKGKPVDGLSSGVLNGPSGLCTLSIPESTPAS